MFKKKSTPSRSKTTESVKNTDIAPKPRPKPQVSPKADHSAELADLFAQINGFSKVARRFTVGEGETLVDRMGEMARRGEGLIRG